MARVQAQLVDWDDRRGFGFARLPGGTDRVFVHVKALNQGQPRPRIGDELEFDLLAGRNHKPAAGKVLVLGPVVRERLLPLHLATAAILMVILQLGLAFGNVPLAVAAAYTFMGGLSLVLYVWDKKAAQSGLFRIPEARLLLVDLGGGIIGGLLAQHMFKHKRYKPSFQTATLAIVLVHSLFLAGLATGWLAAASRLIGLTG
jgi:uncharacterized membrane protein YsdA (DUF1294 family)/cold shock CspA family protein